MSFYEFSNLEAQWAEPVSLTFHSVLRKFYTETSISGISTKFRFIWLLDFRGEDFFINNQKQEMPMVAMFVNGSGRNELSL